MPLWLVVTVSNELLYPLTDNVSLRLVSVLVERIVANLKENLVRLQQVVELLREGCFGCHACSSEKEILSPYGAWMSLEIHQTTG